MSTPETPLRVLLEMRPALAGHAGIPQETRLLFRGLSLLDNVQVEGLVQSTDRLLARGLPPSGKGWWGPLSPDRQLNRLGRVVVSLEQLTWLDYIDTVVHTVAMAIWRIIGGTEELSRFEARHFRDYLWRRFFARTLPPTDFDLVTSARFRIARVPWTAMQRCALITRKFGVPIYPRLDTSDFDMMIAETPYPATVSRTTKLVVRYHDAIPVLMPHTIANRSYHQASHYQALRNNVHSGAWFVCVSNATRRDLLSMFPQAEQRSLTIHNMISQDYFNEESSADRVPEIIRIRLKTKIKPPLDPSFKHRLFEEGSKSIQYLLIVSTIEPRKNHLTLLSAWERLRAEIFPALKLLVVGENGWRHKPIVRKFRPWMERGDVFLLEDVPTADLRLLYKHSRATICPSFGEGFDFSGVEAMRSGTAVVASDIEVHREIYADAAEFCDPYSSSDVARAIARVIDPARPARRDELIARGAINSQRYLYDAILPKWQAFLNADASLCSLEQ